MARMTKTSKQNLLVADRLEIDHYSEMDVYFVRIFKGSNMAYLSDSSGAISYPSIKAARTVTKRIRPDLEPTSFTEES